MPPYVLAMAMEDPSNAKTPDTETPPQPKSISFTTNGSLKRHHHHPAPTPQPVVLFYKECLKNHAANIGGLALDGCGEFMPSPTATQADPTSLKCAACGCHRNFHRRELDDSSGAAHFISFHHPQRLPPPLNMSLTPSPSQSPPPPAVTPYSSAPHMLLALSNADEYHHQEQVLNPANRENPSGRKRFRTKFSQAQKEKMQSFAEKLGWKLHKSDERLVEEFCNEVGVRRGVLKVWMHNNKHNIGKRDHHQIGNNINSNSSHGNGINHDDQRNGNGNGSGNNSRASFDTDAYNTNTDTDNHPNEGNSAHLHLSTNGSSSSS